MFVNSDFNDLLRIFNANSVLNLLIDSYTAICHQDLVDIEALE
jgi:hypothetical protein